VIEARRFNARTRDVDLHAFGHGARTTRLRRFRRVVRHAAPEGLALSAHVDAIDIYAAWVERAIGVLERNVS
jgi:hypothetical protein